MTSEKIKVLLIDDDEDDYILTRELFSLVKEGNYQLDWAPSYEEGLAIASRREHCVCLVDYRLGEHSGVELIREAREARLTTPMILLTGWGDHDVDVEAMEAGATDYLVKDETSPARLERTIRYAVQLNAERCRVEAELAAYAQKQTVVAELGRLALTGGELKDLLAETLALVTSKLGVEYCKILELLPKGDELILRAGVGWREEYAVGQATVSAGKESQAGFTLLSDEPVVVEDLRTEARFSGSAILHEHGVVSGMSVIIRGRDCPYGVLGAHTASLRKFAPDDVSFLAAVANVLAEAIGRKHAEDTVGQSEARLRRVIESNVLGIVYWALSGEIVEANDAFLKMVGYSREDLAAGRMRWTEMTPPRYRKLDEKAIAEVGASGVSETYEKEYIRKDGTLVPILIGFATLEGEKHSGVAFVVDISDRKRAENQLRQARDFSENLIQTANVIILGLDVDGNIGIFNQAAEQITGYTAAELNGHCWFEKLVPKDRYPYAWEEFNRLIDGGVPKMFENPIVTKSGEERFIMWQNNQVRVDGEVVATISFGNDITQRKRAEQALRQSESKFRALFENALDAVLIANDLGLYVDANPAACVLLGVPHDELIGHSLRDFTEEDQRAEAARSWEQFLQEGAMRGVLRLRRPDGQVVDVDFSATANFLPGRHLSMLRDVTEHRKVEEQLRQSQKLESVGMLAGGIAHDFNNLLTVITGYSELTLKRLDSAGPLARNVEEIKRAAERAGSLTRQLLAFSRKQLLQPRVLDLNSVIVDVEKMLGRLVGEDMELRTLPGVDLGQVKADPGQIEQVILNLVVNARDAMPKGGKITIETANVFLDEEYVRQHIGVHPGWYVMLAVSDTGHGMDGETQKYIFEPFFTTKEQGRGTGLGLSTVYGIVKQSGGNIWVYSEVGVGTSFKIYLPLVNEQVSAPEATVTHPESAAATETILVAEDEEMVRTLVRDSLQTRGYTVLEAASAEEALLICQQYEGPIDLVLTDVVMPRMSGRDLGEQLAQLRPETRVLYMSGYTDRAIVHHGILDGDIAFIGKPFTPDALLLKLAEVLKQNAIQSLETVKSP